MSLQRSLLSFGGLFNIYYYMMIEIHVKINPEYLIWDRFASNPSSLQQSVMVGGNPLEGR